MFMKNKAIILLLLAVLSLTSCDMFRKLAGRPTAAELRNKKQQIEKYEAEREQTRLKQQQLADSLAIIDSIRMSKHSIRKISELGNVYIDTLEGRYYVVVGIFGRQSNLDRMLKKVNEAGYVPVPVSLGRGTAVAICPSCRLSDAYLSLKAVKREDFCPEDAWILVNE